MNKKIVIQDLYALVKGFAIIYLGAGILLILTIFWRQYLDPSNAVILQTFTNVHGQHIPLEIVIQAMRFAGGIYVFQLGIQVLIYGLSGWGVLRASRSKVWYLAAIPPLFIWGLVYIPVQNLYSLTVPFFLGISSIQPTLSFFPNEKLHEYLYYLFVLCAILGGLLQQHVRFVIKKKPSA